MFPSMGASASSACAAGAAPRAGAPPPAGSEVATLAGGCFWCVEAPYAQLKGVFSAQSGYIGGHVKDPSYDAVCSGATGHAEAVRVVFDPAVVPFPTLLDVFFAIHDPTTLNRQGNDVGTQYRSAIFTHGAAQEAAAAAKLAALAAKGVKAVTQVASAAEHAWYPAEEYHQCYVERNPTQGYVRAVSLPKLLKAKKEFAALFR
jgi:peptide-methionine (S)-S-oxide reductase